VLGVGGTILKHKSRCDEVYMCMVTKGYPPDWSEEFVRLKRAEAARVDSLLGIDRRISCDFPAVRLNTIPHGEFNRKIEAVVREIQPDIIYTHFEKDVNRDHGIVFNAVMVATRPINHLRPRVVCFETLSSSEWNYESFTPNFYVDIAPFLEKKLEAFSIYASEVRAYPHPRSIEGIRVLASKRGMEVGIPFAEAFIMVRDFW